MNRYLLCIVCSFCCSTYCHSQQSGPPSDSQLIKVVMTAVDKSGHLSKLRESDIRLTKDGERQVISNFQIQINGPTSLAIMIDASYSQRRILPLSKSTARVFVRGFIRPGLDRAALLSFADEVFVRQTSTDNVQTLRSSIDKIETVSALVLDVSGGKVPDPKKPIGSKGLLDAIMFACDKVLAEPVAGTRKAIIVFTDGMDNSSTAKIREAIENAAKKDIAVYAIALPGAFVEESPVSFNEDRQKLRRLSEETGGRAYFPVKNEELETILSQIELGLRAQYIVAFRSWVTGQRRDRRLKIEVVSSERKKDNIQLAYRRTY